MSVACDLLMCLAEKPSRTFTTKRMPINFSQKPLVHFSRHCVDCMKVFETILAAFSIASSIMSNSDDTPQGVV
jgi:hypothetical protein